MDKELFSEIKDEEFKYPLYANALEKEGLLGYYKESKYIANSITITARGNIGHSIVRKSDFNAIGRLIILNSKKELNNDFFSEYINSNLKFYIESTGVPQLTAPSLKINKVKYPNLDEQNKISNFILAINKKIELLEKKLVLYQELELSLKNKIFNSFNNNSFVKLKDICLIKKGKQLNKSDMIVDGKYYVLNGGKEPSGYTNSWNVKENTITISEGGNSCGFVSFNNKKFYCGGHCYYLILKRDDFDLNYLFHYLKFVEPNIMRLRVGSGLPNIQKGDIENITILKIDFNQQKEIGNFLRSMKNRMTLIFKEKEKLEIFKKGLLQKMFI